MTLLQDEEWGRWSNVAIANQCAVSDELVRKVRNEFSLPTVGSENQQTTYTTKHGTTATMLRVGGSCDASGSRRGVRGAFCVRCWPV